jgi:hypothetical protein
MRTLTRTLTPDSIGAVESVKAASDIYAPVGGVVEEINEALNDQPNLLNKKPESDGECLLAPCLVSWLGEARHMCRRVWGARTVTGGMGYGRRWSSELHRSHPSPMLGAGVERTCWWLALAREACLVDDQTEAGVRRRVRRTGSSSPFSLPFISLR